MKTFGVLGSGVVGQVLADGLLRHGHAVVRGTREPKKLADWLGKAGPNARVATFSDAAGAADVVVLAVKGTVVVELVAGLASALAGKVVIDATNPIADAPPENGVLRYFTGPNDSLLEQLAAKAPAARLVKAFSCVGNAFMVNPDFGGSKPTMFICGDDAAAKADVRAILDAFGWETEDMGKRQAARAIEPLCMLRQLQPRGRARPLKPCRQRPRAPVTRPAARR